MPFCEKCGKEVAEDAKYCSSCGAYVGKTVTEELSVSADDLVKKVKELVHEGNVTRVIIKDEKGKTLLDMPVTVGVIGVLFAPWLAALGAIAALAANCRIVVERRED